MVKQGSQRVALHGLFALLFLTLCVGCTNVITLPSNLADPQNVYLLDYGRHSALLLPIDASSFNDGTDEENLQFIEYAYGEWDWYALKKDDFLRTFPTLFWPTQGTLGRNTWTLTNTSTPQQLTPPSPSPTPVTTSMDAQAIDQTVARQFMAEETFTLPVESEKIRHLLDDLNTRFTDSVAESPTYNEEYKLYFIPEPDIKYSLFHNCNHEVVDWLRKLGCTVQGNGTFAEFKIKPTASEKTNHTE